MPIPNYSTRRPQSFIYQNKEVVEDTITDNANEFIFGPAKYLVSKAYDAANMNYFSESQLSKLLKDTDTVKFYNSLEDLAAAEDAGAYYMGGQSISYYVLSNGNYVLANAHQVSEDVYEWFLPEPETKFDVTNVTKILLSGVPSDTDFEAVENASANTIGYTKKDTEGNNLIYIIPNTVAWEESNLKVEDAEVWSLLKTITVNGTPVSIEKDNDGLQFCIIPANTDIENMEISYTMTRNFIDNADILELDSPAKIRKELGPIVEENPLAFACNLALTAAGKTVFADVAKYSVEYDAKNVASFSLSAKNYQEVLNKVALTDIVQFLCPVFGGDSSVSDSVMSELSAHVESMSNEKKKRWRRAYFGSLNTTGGDINAKGTVKNAVIAQAKQANSDRFIVVWTDDAKYLTDAGLKTLSNDYVAAIVAGLRSANVPQQGLSKMTVPGIAAIPNMYTIWDDQLLDDIAEQGVFIITQDYKNSDIYIRHQLTTDTNQGLLYWEDSIGVNVDEISYMARDLVEPYVGKRNATPQTLDEINNKWYAALLQRTNTSLENPQIGPQIVQIVDGSVKTYVDKNLKDRIIMTATLVLPLPINTIVVYINAVASI